VDAMLGLCETAGCRRVQLLQYFGQSSEPCGNCDTCLHPPSSFDATEAVQKLLSTIYRVGQRFGAVHVLEVLRGVDSARVKQWQHQSLSTFGIGSDRSEAEWRAILRQTMAQGFVDVDHEQYGSLRLTEAARPVLRGETVLTLRHYQKPVRQRRAPAAPGSYTEASLSPTQQTLFERLRWWRMETARAHNVPAYVIFHDTTLREIARAMPASLEALRDVSGVGEKKLESYGGDIIRLISEPQAA